MNCFNFIVRELKKKIAERQRASEGAAFCLLVLFPELDWAGVGAAPGHTRSPVWLAGTQSLGASPLPSWVSVSRGASPPSQALWDPGCRPPKQHFNL